jgi:phosphoribosylformylglycinamidine (FGAM) synthase-like enzyme
VREGLLSSAHDVAEGGFIVAVAECCLAGGIGATLDLGPSDDPWAHLFGEGPGAFVVSGHPTALAQLAERIPLDVFGAVGGEALSVTIADESFEVPLDELREAHDGLRRFFP